MIPDGGEEIPRIESGRPDAPSQERAPRPESGVVFWSRCLVRFRKLLVLAMFPNPALRPSARLNELRRHLSREPTNPRAWYWKLQLRVLSALTATYGDYSLQLPSNSTRPLVIRRPGQHPRGTKSRAEIRALLHRISQANELR